MQVGENTYHNTDEKHKAKYMATPQTARLASSARAARRGCSREHEESDPAHQRRLVMRELCSDLLMARRGG